MVALKMGALRFPMIPMDPKDGWIQTLGFTTTEVCYDSRGQPRNSDCLAWGPGGRNIFESTKVIGERHLASKKSM